MTHQELKEWGKGTGKSYQLLSVFTTRKNIQGLNSTSSICLFNVILFDVAWHHKAHVTCLKKNNNLWSSFCLQYVCECNFWQTDTSIYKMPFISREVVLRGPIVYFHWGKKLVSKQKSLYCLRMDRKMEVYWSSCITLQVTEEKKMLLKFWFTLGSVNLQRLACNPLWTTLMQTLSCLPAIKLWYMWT